MKLKIGENIDGNRVKLYYTQSQGKPSNMPNYTIKSEKADEFVKKYNEQAKDLANLSAGFAGLGAILGWVHSFVKARNKVITLTEVSVGLLVGLITSAGVSNYLKNKLMDKYEVTNA